MSLRKIITESTNTYKDVSNHIIIPNKRRSSIQNKINGFKKGDRDHGYVSLGYVKLGEGGGIWVDIYDIKNGTVYAKVMKFPNFFHANYIQQNELIKFNIKYLVMIEQVYKKNPV